MSERPFKCPNCGNWYIQVSRDGECALCELGTHAAHHRTGVVDCHFNQTTPHPSEVRMAEALQTLHGAISAIEGGEGLVTAEEAFARAERVERDVPEIVTWAGVLELPGLVDAPMAQRFKSYDAIAELVANSRRPRTDLDLLKRSMGNVEPMAREVPALMARVRTAIGVARNRVMAAPVMPAPSSFTGTASEPVEEEEWKVRRRENMARARAARRQKREAAGVS